MSDRSTTDHSHATSHELSPLQWATGFAGAWLIGWFAVLSYQGISLIAAFTQAFPMALALGGLAYLLRR